MLRRILASCALSLAFASSASAQVVNGGFEDGLLTGWAKSGSVCFDNIGVGAVAHSGNFGYKIGPFGGTCNISQSVATAIGQQYDFSYWLQNGFGTPNSFQAFFGGVATQSLSNSGAFAYTQSLYTVTATTATTVIEFRFQNNPSYWNIDDISVTQTSTVAPEPSTYVLMGAGLLGLGLCSRRRRVK